MLTYQMTYLEDPERYVLDRASLVNFEVKDLEGRDVTVGRYLGKLSENRHATKRNWETALDLISKAITKLAPMSEVSYWQRFNVPHADLLALERVREIDDLMAAAGVVARGLSLATEPDLPKED